MREWMREKMRRRSKRGPNDSESTGKIGQEIPANQPAPLRPSYEAAPVEPANSDAGGTTPEPEASTMSDMSDEIQPASDFTPVSAELAETVGSPEEGGKLVVETQPDSPSTPPPEPLTASQTAGRSAAFHSLRRYYGAALPGAGLLHAALSAASQAHCQDALELCGRNQSLASRETAVDQDGQELRLRRPGRLLRRSTGNLHGTQQPPRTHGQRRRDEEDGGASSSPHLQGGLFQDRGGSSQESSSTRSAS